MDDDSWKGLPDSHSFCTANKSLHLVGNSGNVAIDVANLDAIPACAQKFCQNNTWMLSSAVERLQEHSNSYSPDVRHFELDICRPFARCSTWDAQMKSDLKHLK